MRIGDRLQATGNSLSYVRYIDDFPAYASSNNSGRTSGAFRVRADPRSTSSRRPTTVVERCLLMTTDPGDLVLDPTCGSGTTAYVAEQWGRRWITIDTSRVALALARTRLMAAKFPYYTFADSPDGLQKEAELTRPGAAEHPTLRRHPQGLRLQARAARHAQVDRQQPRHPRGHDPRRDRRRHRPARRDRDSLRPALRGHEPDPRDRPVHRREPLAAPHRLDRRGHGRSRS